MTNTQTPLWKQLNEQRTQGEWEWEQCRGNNRYEHAVFSRNGGKYGSYVITQLGMEDTVEKEPEEIKANAAYTALAVNNLAVLAEALERFVNFVDQQKLDYESAMVRAAKEALNRIS